jgi:hypothetical protein
MSATPTTTDPSSLAFRPSSYWEHDDPLGAILQNVKGTNRRRMITDYWNAGRLEDLDQALLDDTLNDDLRRGLGRIHPSFMGGEYLPSDLPSEVEIVRITLQSTTTDVISIRARKEPGDRLIHYRIVDEYPKSNKFRYSPETSELPFTLGEMITFIDRASDCYGTGLGTCYNDYNYQETHDAEALRYFTSLSSEFYPELHPHYEAVFDEWLAEHTATEDEEEE